MAVADAYIHTIPYRNVRTYIHIYLNNHKYIDSYIHIYVRTYVHTYVHVFTCHVCTCFLFLFGGSCCAPCRACVCVCVCICMFLFITRCTCIYIYIIYTYKHTYMCICPPEQPRRQACHKCCFGIKSLLIQARGGGRESQALRKAGRGTI